MAERHLTNQDMHINMQIRLLLIQCHIGVSGTVVPENIFFNFFHASHATKATKEAYSLYNIKLFFRTSKIQVAVNLRKQSAKSGVKFVSSDIECTE